MSRMTNRQRVLLPALALALAALSGCGGDLTLPSSSGEGVAHTMRDASPLTQPGRRDQEVPEPPTVVVLDGLGNPAVGAEVQWEVTAGGGVVTGGTTPDAEGRATATWILGDAVGVQKLVARVEGAQGSPITFSAVVLF
jgi:hypothetical protein